MTVRLSHAVGLAVVLAAATAVAQGGLSNFDPDTRIYIVRPGDTLWDISQSMFDDNWKWPRIWENNPEVDNPHRIYPEDRLTIPLISGEAPQVQARAEEPPVQPPPSPEPEPAPEPAEQAPEPEPEPEPKPAPTEQVKAERPSSGADIVRGIGDEAGESRLSIDEREQPGADRGIYVRMGDEGIIDPDAEFTDLAMLGGAEERTIYGEHDEVYLSQGADGGLEVGDRFFAYEVDRQIEHPETGEELGLFVRVQGILEVTAVHPESSEALIVYSLDSIEFDTRLAPYEERPSEIVPQFVDRDLEGQIVYLGDRRVFVGAWQTVHIDLGERDGLEPGTILDIYREQSEREHPRTGEDVALPPRRLGQGVAIEVRDRTASVLVVEAITDIHIGDDIRPAPRSS